MSKEINDEEREAIENIGRQKALNYMVNSAWDYAEKHGLRFPRVGGEDAPHYPWCAAVVAQNAMLPYEVKCDCDENPAPPPAPLT